jgi:3'-phosphoadenosine 5'-phosphosulfate sulfotransferase (PAPS reductase)/FAD synthetase
VNPRPSKGRRWCRECRAEQARRLRSEKWDQVPDLGEDAEADSERIWDEAMTEHFRTHKVAAIVGLFSGGNDSTVLAHWARHRVSHFGHCNTGIGIPETRQFVRDTCELFDKPLIEVHPRPGETYAEWVTAEGFPGPNRHGQAYTLLKERGLRQIQRMFVHDPRFERVVFVTGRRSAESERRRRTVTENRRDGSIVWIDPLANWTTGDMNAYREHHDVPLNEVTEHLHMSGECLCGAFAQPGQLEQIRFFYPETAKIIDDLQDRVDPGVDPHYREWGWGAGRPPVHQPYLGPLCSKCDIEPEPPE